LRRRPLAASAAVLPRRAAARRPAGAGAARPPPPAAPHQRRPRAVPATRRVDQVDDYHGTKVADPFRWLEDLDGPETAGWVKAQNAVTDAYLAATPGRDAIRDRLTAMWNYPRVSLPWREGGRLFFTKNTGLQKQSPYYTTRGASAADVAGAALVLDPNEISKDGSTSLSMFAPDPTGTYVAYGLSEGGADWRSVRVRRLADGRDLDDRVDWIRYSGVSWTKDGKGFVYTRYPAPPKDAGTGRTLSGASRDPQVYYHRLGTAQSADVALFRYPKEPTWSVGAQVSEDGRWLFANVNRGTDPENHLYVADLRNAQAPNLRAPLVAVDTTMEASFSPVGVVGTTAYVVTNLGAPKYRLVAVDLRPPRGPTGRRSSPRPPTRSPAPCSPAGGCSPTTSST
jgi:prolyl oligopeptidase